METQYDVVVIGTGSAAAIVASRCRAAGNVLITVPLLPKTQHPFGTMKRWMDQGYFLTRGLVKVRGEMNLTILVYNLKRVLNIIGVEALIAAVVQ